MCLYVTCMWPLRQVNSRKNISRILRIHTIVLPLDYGFAILPMKISKILVIKHCKIFKKL